MDSDAREILENELITLAERLFKTYPDLGVSNVSGNLGIPGAAFVDYKGHRFYVSVELDEDDNG